MAHEMHRVADFVIVAPYTIRIRFDDGSAQTINFFPILAGEIYGPLRDLALFNQVRLDPEFQTLVWPNDADFDAETLHNWPQYQDAWLAMAAGWRQREQESVSSP